MNTPRTDAEKRRLFNALPSNCDVGDAMDYADAIADFARQLETELAEMTTTAKRLAEAISAAPHDTSCQALRFRADLVTLKAGLCVCWKQRALTEARENGLL